ncbi:MAG: Ig-like domain-containing protein, partial [Candidatus Saccharimonadales bacterium]
MKRLLLKAAMASAMLGLAVGSAHAVDGMATNPYAPSYGHHYRHGAIPTRNAHRKMKEWAATHASTQATGTNTLYYRGGTSSNQGNVGVMNGVTKVYLVFYGNGWGSQSTNSNGDAVFSGDPDHAAEAAQEMFKGIGAGGETWSADLTQWCQGISSGASSCPSGTPASSFVPYQSNGSAGILAGVWEDTSANSPINATSAQLGQEAVAAAAHFGNTTAASNRHAYYVIMSAHGDNPDNFKSPTQGYCAWHDWNGDVGVTSSYGDLAFSNQPYNMDLGSSCGVGFVNSPGTLDGWTMTLGHEWHEMVSDQFPAGGWTASSGYENSDECAWLSSGQGASANVTFTTGTFTEQSSWSNDTNECDLTHAILNHGGGNATPTANNGSVSTTQDTAVNGTLSASDSDGDSLTFAVVSNPSHGSVSITNSSTGAFTYTPNAGYSGSDSFTFHAT